MNLIKIWKNKGKIAEGIMNNIFKKEDVEAIAEERMEICKGCDKLDTKGDKCEVPYTQPCCGECGCSLGIKLRSLNAACDLGKWDAVLTDEEADQLEDHLNSQQ